LNADPLPRWLLILFMAVFGGGIVWIAVREPERFWQEAWIPALAIAAIIFRLWWSHQNKRPQ